MIIPLPAALLFQDGQEEEPTGSDALAGGNFIFSNAVMENGTRPVDLRLQEDMVLSMKLRGHIVTDASVVKTSLVPAAVFLLPPPRLLEPHKIRKAAHVSWWKNEMLWT